MTYFDSSHEWIVAAVEELKTEVTQVQPDAQRRPPRYIGIYDWSTVFGPLLSTLVAIKLDVVESFQRVVINQIAIGNRLNVCHDKRSTKRRVPDTIMYVTIRTTYATTSEKLILKTDHQFNTSV